ncbi:ABC transporter ATP-binding protein [Bryobacter aggregatus]|uniref:ABC transporter ATP-binding protein n=1 Tax=Bryobacter aggregatus TaxID=360054 RepID=UPI0004E1E174|nr:ABC transporter ATP-binding protein [Bryobacter aggregatus]
MNKPPIIEIKNLEKIYHVGEVAVKALRGVNLEVADGEFLAIVGHSGSGKSTLFNVLGGLTAATSGSIRLAGIDVLAMSDLERTQLRRGTVGFVFQKYNLLPTLNAYDNIALAESLSGSQNLHAEWFKEVLANLGLAHRLKHKPRAMSGGEQQRVAIARALVSRPKILLADEPTGNLDTENSTAVLNILRDLNKQFGQTILMITHNPEAADFADRKVRMKDGQVIYERAA